MKTKSVLSSKLSALSTNLYGAGGVNCPSIVCTSRGPNAPICSHIVADPGPPLYKNEIGLIHKSFTSLFVYATEYSSPVASPLSFFSNVVLAVALYETLCPPIRTECSVEDTSSFVAAASH